MELNILPSIPRLDGYTVTSQKVAVVYCSSGLRSSNGLAQNCAQPHRSLVLGRAPRAGLGFLSGYCLGCGMVMLWR